MLRVYGNAPAERGVVQGWLAVPLSIIDIPAARVTRLNLPNNNPLMSNALFQQKSSYMVTFLFQVSGFGSDDEKSLFFSYPPY